MSDVRECDREGCTKRVRELDKVVNNWWQVEMVAGAVSYRYSSGPFHFCCLRHAGEFCIEQANARGEP